MTILLGLVCPAMTCACYVLVMAAASSSHATIRRHNDRTDV
jgi:hypothetical protein